MSMQTQIQSLVIRLSDEFKTLHAKIGNLGSLTTSDRTSLTAAINELKHAVVTASAIDDAQATTSTTWSSAEIVTRLDALKAEILGGADAAYDTLLEIQQALAADASGLDALLSAVNARVTHDELGDPDTDFVAVFEAALVA